MNFYRKVWQLACAGLGLLGLGVALLLSPAALAFIFASFAVAAVVVTEAAAKAGRLARPHGSRVRRMATVALGGGSAAGGFVGLGVALGPGVFLIVLSLVVSAPATIAAYGRWLASTPDDGDGRLHKMAQALSYAGAASCAYMEPGLTQLPMNDQELAQAWSASYRALQAPASIRHQLRVVEERATYLAEFERRNAAGLTTWLASGASPEDIPLICLTERRAAYPAINWDELITDQDS
jgi:hypothetical protein